MVTSRGRDINTARRTDCRTQGVRDLEAIANPSAQSSVLGVKTPMDVKGILLPPPSRPFSSESPRRPSGDFRSGGTPTRRRLPGRVECGSQDASALSFRIRPDFPQPDFWPALSATFRYRRSGSPPFA